MESKALWQCPRCQRMFPKANQWHSCAAASVDSHFEGKDLRLRQLYNQLLVLLESIGPFRVDAVKSSINLIHKHHFGGVKVRRDTLRIGFLSREMLEDPRILKTEKLGPYKFGHVICIKSDEDIDEKVASWLKKAYGMQP